MELKPAFEIRLECHRRFVFSRSIPLSFLVSLFVLSAASAQSKGDDSRSEDAMKYRNLVAGLVSSNEKPATKNEAFKSSVRFPRGYDVKVQTQIKAVRQILHDEIDRALPYLIEAIDDDRYCMTIDWAEGDGYYNESVGAICRDVIASWLEIYRNKISFSGPGHYHQYAFKQVSSEWWEERKSRKLYELQVEAIDWAIEHRAKEKDPSNFSDRKNEVAELRKLRDEISTSRKPSKPRGMYRMVTTNR